MDADSRPVMAEAVRAAYRRGEEDELMEPLARVDAQGRPVGTFDDGDYVIFYDLRGEREVELTESFTDPQFPHFRTKPGTFRFATMIEYDPKLNVKVAFPPEVELKNTLCEVVSKAGLRQLKAGETEKKIHPTFFLNGKRTEPFPGEDREFVESYRDVKTFDERPEMCAAEVADLAIARLREGEHEFTFVNFANVDVVGHVENREAIRKAVGIVDAEAGRLVQAALELGMTAVVTADHGTVEKWLYPDGAVDTGHTDSRVPFILAARGAEGAALRGDGSLRDVAPTVLQLLGIEQPAEMTGTSLLSSAWPAGEGRPRVLLVLLDGWGARDELHGNLIAESETPYFDELCARFPHTTLGAAGEDVGLPDGAVGNSEAGHLHLGAGRRIYSDRLRVDRAIEDGSFFENEAFLWAARGAKQDGRRLHLLGIVSFYSSHGSLSHLMALLELARREGVRDVYVHAMLGRRGERPESGTIYVGKVEDELERLGFGKLATVIGRYWSLDREENWDRIEKTYRLYAYGEGEPVPEPAGTKTNNDF